MATSKPIRGRGAADNPPNRFVRLTVAADPDADLDPDEASVSPRTQFLRDSTRSVITCNNSPDIPFEASVNPYRGCEHGCIYCFARTWHEFLGFSAGLDFETKIVVKERAPELLRRELSSPKWLPKPVHIGGITDPYQPIERKLKLTRRCLEVFAEFRNPASLVTKNHLVTRDIDVLAAMAREKLISTCISITTLDSELTRIMEPRTSTPNRRLAAIEALARAGIPVAVNVAPVIPGLTDHELPAIIAAAAKAGASSAGFQPVRLPLAVGPMFEQWLQQHMPQRKEKVLGRIRSMHGGELDNPRTGYRRRGEGILVEQIGRMFEVACRRAGIGESGPELCTTAFRRPRGQLTLFDKLGSQSG